MFAVIKAGGKQHRVAANDTITVNRLQGEAGDVIAFEDVVLFGNEGKTEFGAPRVSGVTVAGEIVEQSRGPKVIAFKKRRRQNSKRKRGHRQLFTVVRITEILTGGQKPDVKAKPKAEAKPSDRAKAESAKPDIPPKDSAAIDIGQINGLGATIKKKLNAAGITTVQQIADWTEADVTKYDADLNLHGRIAREEWVEQAKGLAAGNKPRAKG
jgi:large subunit ribosomal protein L21